MSGQEDAEHSRRNYQAPYGRSNPIPTIQKYQQEKENRRANAIGEDGSDVDGGDLQPSYTERAKEGWQRYRHGGDTHGQYADNADAGRDDGPDAAESDDDDDDGGQDEEAEQQDTSEVTAGAGDPKAHRKKQKKKKDDRAEREVTDPVTHLPVRIHDFTTQSLKDVDENPAPFGSTSRTATGLQNQEKSGKELRKERADLQEGHESMNSLFPPPSFEELRKDIISINNLGVNVGLSGSIAIVLLALGAERVLRTQHIANLVGLQHDSLLFGVIVWFLLGLMGLAAAWELIGGVRTWTGNRIDDTWQDQVWEASREARKREAKAHETETVSWLNSMVGSVWPLINPDLFTSLADTLEDVMQASLPGLVQMVSVEDIGQGSESLRILGIKYLPTGAAGRAVGADGKLESKKETKKANDRAVPGQGQVDGNAEGDDDGEDDDSKKAKEGKSQDQDESMEAEVKEGFEAEEGDFINLEVAFAYRARPSKSMLERTKDIHLYLAFYLPGNIKIPVYVDIRGLVGVCRLRLQLTPDPPFFALCTITFLGQPKVDVSCIPLVKRGINLMDLPLISNFVQSSVDAAMAEYVAPRSLTLDLKDMLVGDDFKKDTVAKGIVVIDIMHGFDFKTGDAAIPLIRNEATSDPYVTVAWAKFGKPMFSTRVLVNEMQPYWRERCYLLVTPQELNVQERVRLQLWDSDRFTADDDLGRVEVDLKKIMTDKETNGRMHERQDGFKALKAGEGMPGKLQWSIGYFSKTRLQECQFKAQTFDKDIRSMDQLKEKAHQSCEKKLREAHIKKGRHSRDAEELEQQKKQEIKRMEDAIIVSAPPPDDYPSGVFSIQIHNITGLSLAKTGKDEAEKEQHREDEDEEGGAGLPSAYCTVIVNHNKIFKTRTKPRNGKPFYNAGTERFIADWRNTEVHISVRDARVDENDALIGIVHLSLGEVFKNRAQINATYPLMGGIGYGRIRISMVWRSVQLQAPPERLGWECGTLEVKPGIPSTDIPGDLNSLQLKLHSNISSGKFHADKEAQAWKARKGDRSLFLPFNKRYASCLAIRFKRHGLVKDHTAAFAVLWLKDIPDEEEMELTLPVWTGDYKRAVACCLDEPGEKVGSIKVKLTFWSGLGEAHRRWASKDPDLTNVLEVLDTARDNRETSKQEAKLGIVEGDGDVSSDSSSDEEMNDDDDDDDDDDSSVENDDDGQSSKSKTNMIDKVKDYQKDRRQTHRIHRGVMQYKMPRTAKWASDKAQRVEHKITGIFSRHTREPGVETEV